MLLLCPLQPQASGSWAVNGDLRAERRKGNELVGNMKYRRNFFGFRGPRKLNVQFPVMGGKPLAHASDAEPAASRAAGHGSTQWSHVGMSSQRQLRAKRQPDAARKEPEEEEDALRPASTSSPASDSKIVLKNVPPHWHEVSASPVRGRRPLPPSPPPLYVLLAKGRC